MHCADNKPNMSNEQKKPEIHILLVSAQAAPNLLPTLDPELKPKEVVLLVTSKMQKQADALESVFREAAVKVSRIDIADERDFCSIENEFLKLAIARQGEQIALNVTGGTKLMALAAQTMAREANWRVFYVDVDTDQVIWLDKNPEQPRKLAATLRLRHYLKGYGFKLGEDLQRPPTDRRFDGLLQTLISQVGSLETPLSQLNYLAQIAEEQRSLVIELSEWQQDSRSLEALLRNFEAAGVLTVKGNKVVFQTEVDRSFAKGGWLELHVFRTISALSGELGIRDKAANLVVIDDQGVKNELDVAFMAKNRLFAIECKTARMDAPQKPGKANDTLFKLAEISRRVGGLGSRGLLASYRKIGESEKRLAKVLGIEVVAGAELNRLDEFIKTWVKKS